MILAIGSEAGGGTLRMVFSSGRVAARLSDLSTPAALIGVRPDSGLTPVSDMGGLRKCPALCTSLEVDHRESCPRFSSVEYPTSRLGLKVHSYQPIDTIQEHPRASPRARSQRPTSRGGSPDSFAQARLE